MEERIEQAFLKVWPNGSADTREYLRPLISGFAQSDCADAHFLDELGCGELAKFAARIWEAMLYARFQGLGWNVSSANVGPDFTLETPVGPVHIEAVAAGPGDPDGSGLPREWQERVTGQATTVPLDHMLLRWTNALSGKLHKYLRDVGCGNADGSIPFVVAINSCLLGPDEHHICGLPLAVTAVFPFGTPVVTMDVATGEITDSRIEWRDTILNANDAPVPMDSFLSPDYACVSAIIGCSGFFVPEEARDKFHGQPAYVVVHNPKATNPLPQPWLPGAIEYVAKDIADGAMRVTRIQ